MKPQRQINQEYLTGERPLFGESGLQINHTLFGEGESPLKECHQIEMENSMFQWKYPLWYSSDIEVKTVHGRKWRARACGIPTTFISKMR